MPSLLDRIGAIWEQVRQSPAQRPSRIAIPRNNIDVGASLGGPFTRDSHYFQVEVNEMFLTYEREWFSTYDPMVLVVSEFTYDKRVEAVPYVVGPTMMERYVKEKMPTGMVFSNTRVAGLHPYRGDRLSLTVVLYRVRRENYARKFLRVIESASTALDFATGLSAYVKVGGTVLDGVEALLEMGDTEPVLGWRQELGQAGGGFEPGYFALVAPTESEPDPNKMGVIDNRLVYGASRDDARPFQNADYVLYSVRQAKARFDLDTLPIYPLWEQVVRAATVADDKYWLNAKANMAALYQAMLLSPDLTSQHALELAEEYREKMRLYHEGAVKNSNLSLTAEKTPSELNDVMSAAASILEM